MARLQILELPEGTNDDRPPFALVIDQVPKDEGLYEAFLRDIETNGVATQVGARGVLVFEDTIDIPSNEVPLGPDSYPVRFHVEGEFEKFREQAEEEIRSVQRRMTASLGRAAITDQERKATLADALDMDRTRDWDDIRNAAAGLRKERDAQAEALERVRDLHRPVEHNGLTICAGCSGWDGSTTDNSPCGYEHCPILKALAGNPAAHA